MILQSEFYGAINIAIDQLVVTGSVSIVIVFSGLGCVAVAF